MAQTPQRQLKELGSKLDTLPSSKDALINLLKQAATCLAELDQSPSASTMESMKPFLDAIVKPELLKHPDRDVKLLVAMCVCEITRITAPEAPYSDDVLKDIFHLIVDTFSCLSDTSGPSFDRIVVVLETLAKYRSCVVMLDLECDALVNEMFSIFFAIARDDHPESVLSSMQTIMAVLLEESEDVQEDLLSILLSALDRERNDISTAGRRLAMNVVQECAEKLEPSIKQFLLSSMLEDSKSVNSQVQCHKVIYDLYCCVPQILSGILPYLTRELLTDQLETRLKAVRLVGDIFALPGSPIPEAFQSIFSEFLKRLSDRVVEVRMSVLDNVKNCLLSNPSRAEAPQIFSTLCDRLLDNDENVQKQVVAVICDVACHGLNAVPLETVKLVAECLNDKSLLVKKYTMERLADIYRVVCEKAYDSSVNPREYDWIPGKILRCLYDKDFRSDIIESILCGSLFPVQFSINDVVKHWIGIFSGFDKVEVKALEKILEQKQRLQHEMQRYLSLRQTNQDKEVPEVQKKILFCFRVMSRSFADPANAEESFQILDQLKDANIWKILTDLVDPNTGFQQARAYQDDLLKILGEKHQLYDFLSNFSLKCAYSLFNKEHVKAILSEVDVQKSAENPEYLQPCMNILVTIARFSPLLLSGSEEELVNLLKDNNDMIKEGVLHILAKAGGTIREQLAVSSSSVDLILERLCLEGSQRQAKYAVHALAAITKDDGLKSLSVLYKRLVGMLEEETHLPTVLQSLGCIAQTAMPVFETRESEIEEFIVNKILKCGSKDDTRTSWEDKSDLCMLKIYGIKTLVKSYLPVKDAHVRTGIDGLLDILRNMLLYGEVSKDIQSSSVDKAHLRLASAKAVLCLSRQWDHKIPVDIFHLTLKTSEINFPQAKRIFLSKVHQYIKDGLLDAKYACAFLFNIFGSKPDELAEDKKNLADIIQMQGQAKMQQLSVQSDANSLTAYPEYILPYLVHALAHNSCPNVDEHKDAEAYNHIYRGLRLVLSMLVHKDEDAKSEAAVSNEKVVSTIASIFQSIKHSEDTLDASKSKNSHAICDLGLAITKRLVQMNADLQGLIVSVSLPPMLYKACEKKDGDDSVASKVKTWLADESVLAHFELLDLEAVPSKLAEDDPPKDNEKDANEIPLGKMLKHIKSLGMKGKKVKKKSVPSETKKTENVIDILNVVRQINLDNLETTTKFEPSNGHEDSLSKKEEKDIENVTTKKRKAGEAMHVPVPKRKRSSTTHGSLRSWKNTSKAHHTVYGGENAVAKLPLYAEIHPHTDSRKMGRKIVKGSDSDLLMSLKPKAMGSDGYHNDEADEFDEHDMKNSDNLKQSDKTASSNVKSLTGSANKRKRKSISGLAKCTSKGDESNTEDLIGCRIKVWWPLDKQFYEGTIKSYDSLKGKHVVLYDDGDVEILCLEKERWELIDEGHKAPKKIKPSKAVSSLEGSSGLIHKSPSGSLGKKSKRIVNGKQSPKSVKHRQKGASTSNLHQVNIRESSEISNPAGITTSKGDRMGSDDSEGDQAERSDKSITKEKESKKKLKPVSRGKRPKKGRRLSYSEEPDEEEESRERLSDDMESVPQGVEKVDKQSCLEGKEIIKSSGELREKANGDKESETEARKANGEEESETEVNKDKSDGESSPREMEQLHAESPNPDDAMNADISDDEPLSKWKHQTGKSSGRKR